LIILPSKIVPMSPLCGFGMKILKSLFSIN
jgi:hypothetical protein